MRDADEGRRGPELVPFLLDPPQKSHINQGRGLGAGRWRGGALAGRGVGGTGAQSGAGRLPANSQFGDQNGHDTGLPFTYRNALTADSRAGCGHDVSSAAHRLRTAPAGPDRDRRGGAVVVAAVVAAAVVIVAVAAGGAAHATAKPSRAVSETAGPVDRVDFRGVPAR